MVIKDYYKKTTSVKIYWLNIMITYVIWEDLFSIILKVHSDFNSLAL